MLLINVKSNKEKKKYLDFRKSIYNNSPYVDDYFFILKKLFNGTTSFINNKEVFAFYVENNEQIVCECIAVYTALLPEYIQLCFFESLPNQDEAVSILVNKISEIGKKRGCKKIAIGLYGHIDYGLGFLYSHYNEKNGFTIGVNPQYYNDFFEKMNCEKIHINSYYSELNKEKFEKYNSFISKLSQTYHYECFNKNRFDYYSKLFTDINNQAFSNHRYYYKREYNEDKEMLKTLLHYMPEESIIFAFHKDNPVGLLVWHPDFNELARPGEIFGAKHYLKATFKKDYSVAQIIEYAIIEEYRKNGLALGMLYEAYKNITNNNIFRIESSWIFDENKDSNSICMALCDGLHKKYITYEKDIE